MGIHELFDESDLVGIYELCGLCGWDTNRCSCSYCDGWDTVDTFVDDDGWDGPLDCDGPCGPGGMTSLHDE